jgi:RHS repeat-associated protein
LVTDVAGDVIKKIDYDSFGNIINDTNSGFAIPFGFAGGLHDSDTGLVRFGFRDYDPEIGRWTAKDPIGLWGGNVDLYGYVANDPVNYIDPHGLASGDWWDPRTYVQFALSWSSFLGGTTTSGGIEQETMTFFNLVGGSFDIYIGALPSPCERSYEVGLGLGRHLGIGYFYGRPDVFGNYQVGGLVLHIGLGVGTPIYFTGTEAASLGLRTPMDTYLGKGH